MARLAVGGQAELKKLYERFTAPNMIAKVVETSSTKAPEGHLMLPTPEWNRRAYSSMQISFSYLFQGEKKENAKDLVDVTLYSPEVNKEDPDDILLCFEIVSSFSSSTYNYFQCSQADKDDKDAKDIFNPLVKELTGVLGYITDKITNSITPEDIFTLIKSLKDELPDTMDNFKWEIDYFLPSEKKEGDEEEQKIEHVYRDLDGVIAFFHFVDYPMLQFKLRVYNASPDYLRVILSSPQRELEFYAARYLNHKIKEFHVLKAGGTVAGTKTTELRESYGEQLIEFFTSCLASTPVTELPENLKLDPQLQRYASQGVSFPVAVGVFYSVLTESLGLRVLAADSMKLGEGQISFESLDSNSFFFIEDKNEVKNLGGLFPELHETVDESHSESRPLESIVKEVQDVVNLQNSNKYEIGFGDPISKRKIFLRFYNYDTEFFKCVQVKFISHFSNSEFLVPYSDLNNFLITASSISTEVIKHNQEIVKTSNTISPRFIDIDMNAVLKHIKDTLSGFESSTCIAENNVGKEVADGAALIDIRSVRFFDFRDKHVDKLLETCPTKTGRSFLVIRKVTMDNGKPGWSLEITEPAFNSNKSKRKPLTSSYRFFKSYPYKYIDVLLPYITSAIDHFKTGDFGRKESTTAVDLVDFFKTAADRRVRKERKRTRILAQLVEFSDYTPF